MVIKSATPRTFDKKSTTNANSHTDIFRHFFYLKGRIPTGNLPNFQRSRVCYAQRFRSNAFPTGFPHITLRSDINDAARTRERLTSDPGASAQITRTGRTAAGKPKSGHKSEDHHSERCLQKQRLTAARTKQRQKRASFLHSSFFLLSAIIA